MNVQRLLTFSTVLLLGVACGDMDPDDAPGETGTVEAALQLDDHDGHKHGRRRASVAVGRGFIELDNGNREFSFRAVRRPNGKTRGKYTIRLTGPDLFFTVQVSCLAVEGNTAWVGGHIIESNADFVEIGSVSYFYAIDNGRGPHAPPDIVSTARFNDELGQDLVFCENRDLFLEPFEIDGGRVRIR